MALNPPLSLSVLAAVILAITLAQPGTGYVNNWRRSFQFSCPNGRVIRRVTSNRNNTIGDRRWSFTCGRAPNNGFPTTCMLSPLRNVFRAPISYRCPSRYVLAGVQSVYSTQRQDRRWRFKCCKQPGYATGNCRWTYYRNRVGRSFSYTVPFGKVVAGWGSIYSSQVRDRRHKFYECIYRRPEQRVG